MERALGALEQVSHIVQVVAGLQLAQVARDHLERTCRSLTLPIHQTTPNDVVHNISKRPAGSPRFRTQLGDEVIIQS